MLTGNKGRMPINTFRGFHLPLGAISVLHFVLAMLTVALTLVALVLTSGDALTSDYRLLVIGSCLTAYPVYGALRVYSFESTRAELTTKITSAWFMTLAVLALLAALSDSLQPFVNLLVIQWVLSAWVIQIVVAIGVKWSVESYAARSAVEQSAIVVGSGDWALNIGSQLEASSQWRFLGIVRDAKGSLEASSAMESAVPDGNILGDLGDLREIVQEHDVRRIFIALPSDDPALVQSLYVDLLDTTADVVWVVRQLSVALFNQSVDSFEGARAVYLNASPLTSYPSAVFIKHILDRLIAFGLLITLAPVLALIAICVKLSSDGPVLFGQLRHGLNAQPFRLLKFRSMRVHSDGDVTQATHNDVRVTAIGKILRKTSLDELPQLFNVLVGDMSLVGPRPHAIEHNDYYAEKLSAYMGRHRVRPGITGLAQVNGFRGETNTIDKMRGRLDYDLEYINTWSLRLDWEIFLKTPRALIKYDAY